MRKEFLLSLVAMILLVGLASADLSTGVDGEIGIDLTPTISINYSLVNVNNSQFWGGNAWSNSRWILQSEEANLNVNSSDYWDGLNSPTEINHNTLTNLQGGGGEGSEFYHLSLVVYDAVTGFLNTANFGSNLLTIGSGMSLLLNNGNITANNFFGNLIGTWNSSSLYIPYTGATGNVNLGIYNISNHARIEDGNAQGQIAFWSASEGKWVKTETSELFWDDTNKRVGINEASPDAKLHIKDGAILAEGTTGGTPASGTGKRMMWIPAKGAFRAGYPIGDDWDDANIGSMSTAFGFSNKASGSYSTCFGANGEASNSYSACFGSTGLSSGLYSIHFGGSGVASGKQSAHFGYDGLASGDKSTVFGYKSYAQADYTLAGGRYMQLSADADNSFAWGHHSSAVALTQPNTFYIFPGGTAGKVAIGTTTSTYPLEVHGNTSGISIWSEANISATGYNTRSPSDKLYNKDYLNKLSTNVLGTDGKLNRNNMLNNEAVTNKVNKIVYEEVCKNEEVCEGYKLDKSGYYIEDCQMKEVCNQEPIKINCRNEEVCIYEMVFNEKYPDKQFYEKVCKTEEVCDILTEEITTEELSLDYLSFNNRLLISELKTENDLMKSSLCKLGAEEWC